KLRGTASTMEGMKHDFINDLKPIVKIEKIDWSLYSKLRDYNYKYQTSENTQTSEEKMHSMSMMDDLKQDSTNDLFNVMKNEKTEFSFHPDTLEYSFVVQTLESILSEETEQQINQSQDMASYQDKPRNSPNKDVHAGNLEDEEQNSSNI
ncbi:zinc finger protein 583, partial [Biomphalaria glabrata]